MADNASYQGTGEIFATEDRGGVNYPHTLISATDGPSCDALGRWRVCNPVTIFDSKLLGASKAPLFWGELLESGADITSSTPTAAKPYIDITSTLNTAGKFTRQTFRHFNHRPGGSQFIAISGVLQLSGGGTGVERRMGYFDDNNGVFFTDNAGVVGLTMRTNDTGTPVDSTTVQADWNMDKMDGSKGAINPLNNPSGETVDWSKVQLFIFDFLSAGRMRVGLQLGGTVHYLHEINNVNTLTIPWASTPNLPIRFQMITTSSSPASTMRLVSSSVMIEGEELERGLTHTHATVDHVNANVADTLYTLVGIRLKAADVGCNIELVSLSILMETKNVDFEWCLVHNATVAGTFTFSDHTDSCVQEATGDTANPSANTQTGGTVIARGFGTDNSVITLNLASSLTLGVAIGGTLDTLTLAVRPLSNNADVQGSIIWREII